MALNQQRRGIWDASECALLLIDYQQEMFDRIYEQDRRLVELNVRTLAMFAVKVKVPVILSTVGVQMGFNGPTILSLQSALPGVTAIDRSSMDAWEDRAFVEAVEATGRKRLVICGLVTSVCLACPAVDCLAAGYEVAFIEDAVADEFKNDHDIAVLRLAHAGAVPITTSGMMCEWFRDWNSPLSQCARDLFPQYLEQVALMKGHTPVRHTLKGPTGADC